MAKQSSKGTGPNWSKMSELVAFPGSDKWCSEYITENTAYTEFVIPKDLTSGVYYVRGEILDVEMAYKSNYDDYTMGPASYANCFMVNVTDGGAGKLEHTEDLINAYKPLYKKAMGANPIVPASIKMPGFALPKGSGPTNIKAAA
ncbi:hypothetical protein IWW38_000886 [Coemansia aciculifera]|uniref:Uncharacterized protein n=1 Tax=Coemansia aciculifera TaxID=417176 RepID=A0ACC1M9K7_9FUNG|nr:hypothetical protein IWW38_000886 [Coemansia aciculifera]